MNPRNDIAILQQLYGPDEHHAHIEAWHLKRSLDTAAYVDYYRKRDSGIDFNAERDYQRRTYGSSTYDGEKK